ncbi:MAG TPA: thymidine phosphorylase [Candidatus Kryptonia bacterium]
MLTTYEIIRKKRDGGVLSENEIAEIVSGYTSGELPDYQMSAFLMSVFFKGMSDAEILALIHSMISSGVTVDLSDIPGSKADKHSTGGVGDKISLLLAPIAAACGIKVPMVSGRGLGHTGGTVDKLESIPGFRTALSTAEYKRILNDVGLVMSAQSDDIVPADRKMYALRDVTATIESIPLITSSIMSKKLAEGIDALVLDIKVGNGAFMKKVSDARLLARKMVKIGKLYGKKTAAYLTGMNQPLGHEVGNWNEVVESIDVLSGKSKVRDVTELTLKLTGEMLSLCTGESLSRSVSKAGKALASGAGYEKFLEMVRAQGGDVAFIQNPEKYPAARRVVDVSSLESGYVKAIDTRKIGMTAVRLGAGRMKAGEQIDPAAGIRVQMKIGDRVARGEVIAIARTNRDVVENEIIEEIRSAYVMSAKKTVQPPLIMERIAP